MSGGVDSSVAALLMKEAGHDCLGVMLHLYDNEDAGLPPARTCCSLGDAEDARAVAYRLGMPFYVFNFTGEFREQVIGRFVDDYEHGRTPNPCIECNRRLKFGKLLRRAAELECDALATGHYARIEREDGRYLLKKAFDSTKDQSYVLYMLTQEQLAHLCFPLGALRKAETRRIAARAGFANARKRDSQDICFVPDGDYARAVERHAGKPCPPGDFVDGEGRVLGRHAGVVHYTVGQHRGLGLSLPTRSCVCAILPESNTVVLGSERDLYADSLTAGEFHWISGEVPVAPLRVKAKIRYRQPEQPALVTPLGRYAVRVTFDEPQRAVTPGQAVVLYDGDTVLGGGIIR